MCALVLLITIIIILVLVLVFSKFTVNLQWYAFSLTQIEKLHRIISGVIRVPLQFPLNGNIAISWRMEMGRMMVVKPAQLLSKRGLLLPAAVGLYKDNWVGNDPLHGPSWLETVSP